jgi:hypothetical protein
MPVVPDPVPAPVGAPDALLFGEELLVCAYAAPESVSASARAMSFMGGPFVSENNDLFPLTFQSTRHFFSAMEAAKLFSFQS